MDGINERIIQCIKKSGLTKTAFAKKIDVSQPFVSQLCSGTAMPSDRTIKTICRVFDINEAWLRTGDGEMLSQRSRRDEIADLVGGILHDDSDFRQRFISALSRMSLEEWKVLEKMVTELADEVKNDPTPTTKLYVAARDGSRIETEVEGGLTIPEEDSEIP